MSASTYKIYEGSLQERFDSLRTKVQVYGGGFANGKTSASCVLKALRWAMDYPGSNGLMARSTYPKLNDTLRKEFLKWCPKHWIKSFPRSANGSNTCTLTNGSTINFRYIAQQGGSSGEASTSNLLSATYDWIIVDQMEDPEIIEKDFDDLLGRLRGMTPYVGDDPTMPRTGPRYFVMTLNPTRNWVYKKIIRPLHVYQQTGKILEDLLCRRDNGQPILNADGKPELLIGLVEGSTYENKENLSSDFIETLESTYRGAMRERFLMGGWAAYEGLVYPMYDPVMHQIEKDEALHYMTALRKDDYQLSFLEGYDFGLAMPSCYILAFVDAWGNIIQFDGFYTPAEHLPIDEQRNEIMRIRSLYGVPHSNPVYADPSIFRRTSASTRKTVGQSTADMFWNNGKGVRMVRGNNDIANGIIKVSKYLSPQKRHAHPVNGLYGAPYLYHTSDLEWISTEYGAYIWKRDTRGDIIQDQPRDKGDHAMDTTKYMLSRRPDIATLPTYVRPSKPSYMGWRERDLPEDNPKSHRYG